MKIIDYILDGYNIVTSQSLGRKIKEAYPGVLVFTDRGFDGIPNGKLLVDRYYSNHPAVLNAKPLQSAFVLERFDGEFIGEETLDEEFKKLPKGSRILSEEETNRLIFNKPNLLEIKLKDTDSMPEVYYKGERLDELPKGLVDISYHWRTDGLVNEDRGANDINIEYYSTSKDKFPDKKTIGHKRDC